MSNIFCAECGTKMDAGAVFCDGCGHRVEASPGDGTAALGSLSTPPADPSATLMAARSGERATPSGDAAAQGAAGPYGAFPPQPAAQPGPYYAAPATTPAANGNRNRILIGAGAAVLVAVGFFGGTHLFGGDDQADAQPTPVASAGAEAGDAKGKAAGGEASVPTGAAGELTPAPGSSQAPGDAVAEEAKRLAAEQAAADQAAAEKAAAEKARAERVAAPPAETALAPIDQRYRIYARSSGYGGAFPNAATLTSRTSRPFMRAVADAYAASGANGGSIALSNVYSSVTGKTYPMTCNAQSDSTVICWGGVGARVLLYAR